MNCGNLGEGSGGRDFSLDTNISIASIWCENVLGYLPADVMCFENRSLRWTLRSRLCPRTNI